MKKLNFNLGSQKIRLLSFYFHSFSRLLASMLSLSLALICFWAINQPLTHVKNFVNLGSESPSLSSSSILVSALIPISFLLQKASNNPETKRKKQKKKAKSEAMAGSPHPAKPTGGRFGSHAAAPRAAHPVSLSSFLAHKHALYVL